MKAGLYNLIHKIKFGNYYLSSLRVVSSLILLFDYDLWDKTEGS